MLKYNKKKSFRELAKEKKMKKILYLKRRLVKKKNT